MSHKAIRALYPKVVTINGETDATDKDGNKVIIDQSLIDAWVNPNAYKQSRADAYPTIEAQLDSIFHEGVEGWKDTIQAIKVKYPKGTE